MRLSAATFLALATAAPRLAYGGEDDFAHIRSLIAQLENETNTLAALYAAKEDEIADLVATCGTTSSDELSGSPSSTKTQAPITPATSGSPNKAGSVSTEYSTDGSGSNNSEEYSSSSNRGRRRKKPTEGNNSSGGTGEPTEGGSSSGTEEPIDKGSSSGTEEPVVGSSSGTNKDSGPVTGGRWTPKVGDSYAYNLKPPVDMDANFDVFFIYFNDQQATIDALHAKGKAVVCYINTGAREEWQADKDDFPSEAIGNDYDGWDGEQWLDISNPGVRDVMAKRVANAASMGCDAIEPDNMMVYIEKGTGVDVSEADQIEYNTWFADLVHSSGMLVGMKNAMELLPKIADKYDFAINEECFDYGMCGEYTEYFIAKDKPVFNIQYDSMDHCSQANDLQIYSIVKNYIVDAPVCCCSEPSNDVECGSIGV